MMVTRGVDGKSTRAPDASRVSRRCGDLAHLGDTRLCSLDQLDATPNSELR